ncbi:apolipoprotein C-II [Periophthalmus magnuspinnatus]|uniref:Apolipoprotein C-II n=1 Tax=Periophthalmus magnuspinnatus TaxID=409849 RepID=A0A3B3ZI10_9GOBI|nr:apolipoprotein C-II [Periophthalmus magnuspinnatus]
MNKLLVITVFAALLAINVEGFRVSRQVVEEEEQGTLTKMTNAFRSYYENAVNTASGYLDSIKGLKLEEKAKNMYEETTKVMSTYTGIVQDQLYHIFYQEQ